MKLQKTEKIRLYHLSHIDLDGYGCQYLTNNCFANTFYYNANYGPEVSARMKEIVNKIEQDKFLHGDNIETLILVTDLNLTTKEGNWIEKQAIKIGAKLQLLDHHASGQDAADRFAWYKLDTSKCATLITYDWISINYGFDKNREFNNIVKSINAIDIWVDNDTLFEYGKVMLGMISGAREINRTLFPTQDRDFKFSLITSAINLISEEQNNIKLDNSLHSTKKSFFLQKEDDTKDNLVANYVTRLLTKDRQRLTIHYKGHKGILGYNIGSASIIGNTCMVENDDYDFYMDINFRGNFSLRSNNKLDVSEMASVVGNGGGHPNASGGKISGYKDSFVYSEVKDFVQNHIDSLI